MLPWPVVFVPAWLLHLWSAHRHHVRLQRATKPVLLLLLLLWYLTGAGRTSWFVVFALLFGLAGDVLLMLPDCPADPPGRQSVPAGAQKSRERLFLAGLGAFLAGHVAYILAFLSTAGRQGFPPVWLLLGMTLPLLIGFRVYLGIRGAASEPKPVLIAYILVIAGMTMAAMLAAWSNPDAFSPVPVLGALLFLLSDTALSFTRYGIRAFTDTFVMATYGLAQALLTGWFIHTGGGRLL